MKKLKCSKASLSYLIKKKEKSKIFIVFLFNNFVKKFKQIFEKLKIFLPFNRVLFQKEDNKIYK